MSDNIPFEMQSEIIKRLPVKSLLRFRSVSKPWKFFIDSPKLASSYGIHHTKSHRLITRYLDAVGSKENYVSVVDDDTFPQQKFSHTVPALAKLLQDLKVSGCSQGLLCMHGHFGNNSGRKSMAVLWNMSIRKSIDIVVPGLFESPFKVSIGFGVCPVSNDPMIVKIMHVENSWQLQNKVRLPWQAHVFTLSSGSWKSISKNLPSGTISLTDYQVVIDKFLYWLACDDFSRISDGQHQSYSFIMSFDMITQEFKVVDLPDILENRLTVFGVSKLRDSLAVFDLESINDTVVCVVWMMEDVAAKLFTKKYTINTNHAHIKTLGFRKNGELIIEATDDDVNRVGLVSHEPSSALTNDLLLYGKQDSFFVSSYEETFLLLDQIDCSILESFN